jgi:hypothetical protein
VLLTTTRSRLEPTNAKRQLPLLAYRTLGSAEQLPRTPVWQKSSDVATSLAALGRGILVRIVHKFCFLNVCFWPKTDAHDWQLSAKSSPSHQNYQPKAAVPKIVPTQIISGLPINKASRLWRHTIRDTKIYEVA